MKNQAQNLVNCFLSSDFSTYTGAGISGFSGNENEIFINNELIIYKKVNNIFIQNGHFAHYACLEVLGLFPNVTTHHSKGELFVNGLHWDGKKTALSLFE